MFRFLSALLLLPSLAAAQQWFQLPSGNIHCSASGGWINCQIVEYAYRPPFPRPRDCDGDWGPLVELGSSGMARMGCYYTTVVDPNAPVLRYGSTWQGQGIACTASQSGLRCVNREGRGFELSRARLHMF